MSQASDQVRPILPGATLGVLGSGQLGRMFAIAARYMGYRVITFSPDHDTPTGQVADLELVGQYDDYEAIAEFAKQVDVITLEFENIDTVATDTAAKFAPVRPGSHVLHIAQNRTREKTFLSDAGLPVTPFIPVHSLEELKVAAEKQGLPGVLKTANSGYDGKGQVIIKTVEELAEAWASLETDEAILEAFINYRCEVSMIAARNPQGEIVVYGPMLNHHENHILDTTTLPSGMPEQVRKAAEEVTRGVMEALDVIGVLCVEFFVTEEGEVMINEIAPRPHNSGHLTIEACVTSQFEQQVRAICGLPLGDPSLIRPAVMKNILGDLWVKSGPRETPDWAAMLSIPDAHLHLYGKAEDRVGRKMGHLTVLGESVDEVKKKLGKWGEA